QVHMQEIGWGGWFGQGQVAGGPGQGKRLEAIRLRLVDCPGWMVQYKAHVQNIGWMGWVEDGQTAGTEGRSLRMEAVEIRLVHVSHDSTSDSAGGFDREPGADRPGGDYRHFELAGPNVHLCEGLVPSIRGADRLPM